jgi:vacuolar-type H+-ATPase subunit H
MMPVTNSINGEGKLQSEEITLLESATFDKMKETLKLGDKYGNTFRDINISFRIADGRIYLSPFDVKTGNLKMNISGDQGIDQTLNYLVKTEIPRTDLGSSVNTLIDNLSSKASAFGIAFKPSDILKVNIKVTGTFTKPIVAPFFGSTGDEATGGTKATVKDAVKQTVENVSDKAKEKARGEAELQAAKLVKEAEERGQQLRDEAASAAEKLRNEADVQAKNLIAGAESKGAIAKLGARKGADTIKKTADKKADQLVEEADVQAKKLVEEAKTKGDELVKKI